MNDTNTPFAIEACGWAAPDIQKHTKTPPPPSPRRRERVRTRT